MKPEIKERIEQIQRGEVPEGYKKSSHFIIPIDWESSSLEKLCEKNGLVRGPFGSALKKEFFVENGYKVYEQKNAIYKDYNIGNYFIDEDKFKELSRFEVNRGDFIVSCSGTIGKIYKIPRTAPKGIINQALLKIRLNNQLIHHEYFYQYFEWRSFQNLIIENTQGGAIQNLVSMKIFKKTKINLPTIYEQKKIADILIVWDKAIDLKQQLIDQKKEQKRELMQLLLSGKIRLKGYNEKWKRIKVGNILRESKIVEENPSVEKLITVKLHLNGVTKRELVGNETVGATTLYKRRNGQFIYGKQNFHNGAIGIIPEELDGYASSSDIPSFDFNNGYDPYFFLYYWSRSDKYKRMESRTTGTGSKRLSPREFLNSVMIIPEINEQKAIANVLLTTDKEISLLEQELEQLKEQKKGLMQLLLTGIVRVGD